MDELKVTNVVDGDMFDVTPNWNWQGQTGRRVRIANYDAPELSAVEGEAAKLKLSNLILGKPVELKNCVNTSFDRLVCDVYLDGSNIVNYLLS
jgi:endonuclease YncB( thermonuclease family)